MRQLKLQALNHNKEHFYYRIADVIYQSDTEFAELEFLIQAQASLKQKSTANHSAGNLIYQQKVIIGEREYEIQLSSDNKNCYQLRHQTQVYSINKTEVRARLSHIDITLLMGPVIILNLALNKVYCLHASAFTINRKIFILMGNSGTGKSTIARYMGQQANGKRLADDILPVKIDNNKFEVLPSFPQLKLTQAQQSKPHTTSGSIILLFAQKSSDTTIKAMDSFISIKKLINHTVATKLFNNKSLKNHLDFCYQSCQKNQCFKLSYQHTSDSLPKLYQQLNALT